MKFTKIVCTIGLKTEKKEYLTQLVEAWMNVMRLNFSHGDHQEHGARIKTMREITQEKDLKVAILLDTQGPEIRTKKLEWGKDVLLEIGQTFTLTIDDIVWNKNKVAVTYSWLTEDLKTWDTVLLDDGLIKLVVQEIQWNNVICEVMNTWELGEKKWVNLPGVKVNLPALSPKDIEDIIFGCKQWVDYIAASFIRKKSDVEEVRALLNAHGWQYIKIISKIENQEWVDNFEEILEASHGIMVARWDLWVELPMQELPLIQKSMVERAVEEGKIVITATQMLESMIKNPRPTRAEISDIANAIFDGTDAVMLSWETSKHNCAYPVEAVQTMASICERIDQEIDGDEFDIRPRFSDQDNDGEKHIEFSQAIAKWAFESAKTLGAKLIVVSTVWWRSARNVRKYFPKQPILVLTPEELTARQVMLIRGVVSEVIKPVTTYKWFYEEAKNIALEKWLVKKWDVMVIIAWSTEWEMWLTDMIKITKV